MSKQYALSAAAREKAGKGASRALRRENQIPAVIYGDGKDPIKVSLNSKDINLEYNKGHMFTTICELGVEKDKHQVLARDVQVHPVKGNVMHVDFLRVTPKTRIAVDVPVHFINHDASPGIKDEKGVLNVVRHEVELFCLATAIPDQIEADLTGLQIGGAVKISNAAMPEGSKPVIDDRDFTLATLIAPRVFVEETPETEEGEEAAEGGEGAEGKEGEDGKAEGGDDKPAEGEEGKKE